MQNILLISIKPKFVDKIFNGTKKIELRKAKPKAKPGDLMIIYSTKPEKAIVGICRIEAIIDSTPSAIWQEHHQDLGVDEGTFFKYYSNNKSAIGISLEKARRFKDKIPLDQAKQLFPTFMPPQTFKYFDREFFMCSSPNLLF